MFIRYRTLSTLGARLFLFQPTRRLRESHNTDYVTCSMPRSVGRMLLLCVTLVTGVDDGRRPRRNYQQRPTEPEQPADPSRPRE